MSDEQGYNHRAIEKKWQEFWIQHKTFKSEMDRSKPKYYVLDMFPYPSGEGLHVGHPEGYTATDITARYKRMHGFNVLHPMGWDAFGLPTERYAERTGQHPTVINARNTANFRRQCQELGFSYDWDREIDTTDPKYYKWTQWIFTLLLERGLAYQIEAPVNWCPALGTVLANEEVKDGLYVETGDPVEKRMMRQWMLRITAYAERLLADLEDLDWPDGIKAMQREWIGRSEGADVVFAVAESKFGDRHDFAGRNEGVGESDNRGAKSSQYPNFPRHFTVFTTRPDTLFGATYCVLAPEHPLTLQVAAPEHRAEVQAYVDAARRKSAQDRMKEEHDKTGVFTGAYAVNPINGKEIPIWTADYVLAEYGYGAIMAVPGHDARDYEFAEKFALPIIEVISGGDISKEAYTGDGTLVNSPLIDGLRVPEAKKKITAWLEEKGIGRGTVNYKLRDWLFSRQKYWGEPFPIIHLEDGSVKPLSLSDLPLTLPELHEFKPTADGQPPLARAVEWMHITDPETGKPALRDVNTMPQWAGSCWYYLRFCDPHNDAKGWDPEKESYWMPVDLYIGGAEHAVLHLLYARFWHKVLFDLGLVSTSEPFKKLFNQGMIVAYSYRDELGKYHYPREIERRGDEWVVKADGRKVETQIEKMSKSRYNVVNPDDVVRESGADSLRLYEMFMGPLDRGGKPWTEEGVQGVHRFLKRVWALFIAEDGSLHSRTVGSKGDPSMVKELHKAIKAVTNDIETLSFNTAISRMMEFVNAAMKVEKIDRDILERFILILAPFAPHIAEEIWQRLGHKESLAYAPWPEYDEKYLVENTINIPIQVMGKMRATIEVAKDADKNTILAAAKANPTVQRHIEGKIIVKEIFVPGKMVNFVVK